MTTPIRPTTQARPIPGFTPSGWETREKRRHATKGELRQIRALLLKALDAIEDGNVLSAKQARLILQLQLRPTEERIIELLLKPERHWVPRGDLTLPIWQTITFKPIQIEEIMRALKGAGALCPELEQILIDAGWPEDQSTSIDAPTPIHLVRFNAGQVFKTLLGESSSYGALGTLLDDENLERLSWSKLSTSSIHTLPVDLALQLHSLGAFGADERVVIATPNIGPTLFWKVLGYSRFSDSGTDNKLPYFQVRKSFEGVGFETCNADVIFQYVSEPELPADTKTEVKAGIEAGAPT